MKYGLIAVCALALLVKHNTAKVISTMVMAVSAVRNLRLRMFAMPNMTAVSNTLSRAKLAPSVCPRPLRIFFSSVSNLL